jgi:hypothetical protein
MRLASDASEDAREQQSLGLGALASRCSKAVQRQRRHLSISFPALDLGGSTSALLFTNFFYSTKGKFLQIN